MARLVKAPKPAENFLMVESWLIKTDMLSPLAKVVYMYLQDCPPNWTPYTAEMAKRWKMCEETVSKAIQELKRLNILTHEPERDPDTGKICGMRWIVHGVMHLIEKVKGAAKAVVSAVRQDRKNQGAVKPGPGKNGSSQTNSIQTDGIQTLSAADAGETIVKNSLLERVRQLAARSQVDPRLQRALKKREEEEAQMQRLQAQAQDAQGRARQAMYGKYLALHPEDAVKALCGDYLKKGGNPYMDSRNRAELVKWLLAGGQIERLVDAFVLAKQADAGTAKYVLRVLE